MTTLADLKKRATAAELTLIERIEESLRAEVTAAVLARLEKKIDGLPLDWVRGDTCRPQEMVRWIQGKWKELREEESRQ